MIRTPRIALFLLTTTISVSAQQSYVERMNEGFNERAPHTGDMLPDASAFTADGKPFALKETRGKLTVLVTGCLT